MTVAGKLPLYVHHQKLWWLLTHAVWEKVVKEGAEFRMIEPMLDLGKRVQRPSFIHTTDNHQSYYNTSETVRFVDLDDWTSTDFIAEQRSFGT